MKKKIISFSLWGDNPTYTVGAIKNAKLAEEIYPGWICRFYTARPSVPEDIINQLSELKNTELVFMDDPELRVETEPTRRSLFTFEGMFWRFDAAIDSDVMISRDTDSRLGPREKAAVDEWLNSDKDFHIMRDNIQHGLPIMGGMWGVRNGLLSNIEELIDNYRTSTKKTTNQFNDDQLFLLHQVYPLVYDKSMQHDSHYAVSLLGDWKDITWRHQADGIIYGLTRPFPWYDEDDEYQFVGQQYAADQ